MLDIDDLIFYIRIVVALYPELVAWLALKMLVTFEWTTFFGYDCVGVLCID